MPIAPVFLKFSSLERRWNGLEANPFQRPKTLFFIPWEPRIRYFLIVRDPVVSGIRYFFIPRDPVVPCVWWCPGGAFFLFGGEGFFSGISLSLRLPLSLRSRDATISLRLYGAETANRGTLFAVWHSTCIALSAPLHVH